MKAYLEVYGCTANKGDASLIKGILKENNHEIVDNINDSNAIVVLTCTVIDTTEQRMISRLKELKKSGKKIVVAGCMASIQSDKIKSIIPDAQFLPPQYSHNIINVLEDKPKFTIKNKTAFSKSFDDIFAPISVAEGCIFSCSYCITSLARGKLKSFPINEIKNDVSFAVKNGCKEIQLTAQDTSSYGFDTKSDLGRLLRKISTIKGEYRIRVGMMNPFTCLKNLESIIEGYHDDKIYKFLHLPVQSGDNKILEKMNRKYTVDEFKEIIRKFREKYPNLTISTDVIVGFPTETDQQFLSTIDLLKEIKPDITNITRFSARPYTKAKKMRGRIKTEIVKQRSKELTNVVSDISKDSNYKHINKKYRVLITEEGKQDSFVGRSENYKPVVLKDKVEIGAFYDIEIIDTASTYLVGRLI
jgi:MiaB-like tRNA modifying enzyme